MHHFTNNQHGAADLVRGLFDLLSQCIADLTVVGEHGPMPEYTLELAPGFDIVSINIPKTETRPNDAVTLLWTKKWEVLQVDVHHLEKTFRIALTVDDARDAKLPRSYNEEVLTTLEVIRQILIKKTQTRLIPVNPLV